MEAAVLSYKIREEGEDLNMDGEGVRKPEEGFGLREEEGVVTEALGEDLREVFKNFFLTIVFEDEEVPVSVGVEGSEVAESV